MQQKKPTRMRRTEVLTGLMLLLLAFSYVAALLLDFKFISSDATLQENLAYLSEHTRNQLISSGAWLAASLLTLAAVPLYLKLFRPVLRVLPYLNVLLMAGTSAGFLLMARAGFELQKEVVQMLKEGLDLATQQERYTLLFNREQFYRHLGSSCVGIWAFGLCLTRFRLSAFPLASSVLLMIAGPVLVFFNWFDPDHIARTCAMAGIIIGVMVFCIRLINKGLDRELRTEPGSVLR